MTTGNVQNIIKEEKVLPKSITEAFEQASVQAGHSDLTKVYDLADKAFEEVVRIITDDYLTPLAAGQDVFPHNVVIRFCKTRIFLSIGECSSKSQKIGACEKIESNEFDTFERNRFYERLHSRLKVFGFKSETYDYFIHFNAYEVFERPFKAE